MQAFAEADEMKAKGYTYNDETRRQTSMEALKNGLPGTGMDFGGGGVVGDIVGLGVALGTVNAVTGFAKDALGTFTQPETPAPAPAMEKGWDCACGAKNIATKFCPECGAKKPEPPQTWDCACGAKNIATKFCPECGAKKPEPPQTWDCACGAKNIATKFCPECGAKKPETPQTWDCACGAKNITTRFCPECGSSQAEDKKI